MLPLPSSLPPFRAPIVTQLNFLATHNDANLWLPRAGNGSDASDNVLQMLPPPVSPLSLAFGDLQGPQSDDLTPLPMLVAYSPREVWALGVFHSLNDTVLAGQVELADHHYSFSRLFDRLDHQTQRPVHYTTYLMGFNGTWPGLWQPAMAWRQPMAWMQQQFPVHMLPRRRFADALGVYTCGAPQSINSTALALAAATVQWDATFPWPYIGLYAPPNATWASNTGDGEETDCGAFTHGQRSSRQDMAAYYQDLYKATDNRVQGLTYFNLFELGENVQWPLDNLPPPSASDWTNSSLFIARHFNDAVLQTKPRQATYTWQNAIVLDPGAESWAQFLLQQANNLSATFGPEWFGIVVDRLDHINAYNMFADDNISWCGQPCRSLLPPFIALSSQIADIVRATGPHARAYSNFLSSNRLDSIVAFDGLFTEGDTVQGRNTAGLSTMAKTAIQWTYDSSDITGYADGGVDGFMQHHLYLGVFPMAPVLGADHSIPYSTAAQQWYTDYGPLFQRLAGAVWWLHWDGFALNTTGRINGFVLTVPDNATGPVPGTAGMDIAQGAEEVPDAEIVIVVVRHPGSVAQIRISNIWSVQVGCQSIRPGEQQWTSEKVQSQDWEYIHLTPAVTRQAVMVHCKRQ